MGDALQQTNKKKWKNMEEKTQENLSKPWDFPLSIADFPI
jgi:hypothetical protein